MRKTSAIPKAVKHKALVERDLQYAGLFYVAVKTTGVFCRIGCPARTPKPENVMFFDSVKEALDAGFRPCKLCKPLEKVGETPAEIRALLNDIHRHPELRITESGLIARGIQPERLRRWFKKQHGITFHAYQRYVKIGRAVQRLKAGEPVTQVALDGYESLSGFQDSFKQAVGRSPSRSADQAVIQITRLSTPLGLMMAGAIHDELCLLEFCDRRMLATELEQITKSFHGVLIAGHCAVFDEVQRQLDQYFEGQLKAFDLPLNLAGTPFQQRVWKALLTIPYGKTRSYKEQALMIRQPEAVRAVARANGMNRLAIVIPCHRVLGSDGGLTGYGGGLERKEWLLSHERRYA
jgi:AraC family transcriptional regulator, regulatory protein of adaptative response / methylated-DNA-[protein]-cysteine methyltransferase